MSDRTTANIGKILDDSFSRDAIHVAVAPVVAGVDLEPGQRVSLFNDGTASPAGSSGFIGIVDPFLRNRVNRGERFFLFLFPGSITSLRHEWTHDAFKPEPSAPRADAAKEASRKWLADLAPQFDMDYDGLMAAAKRYVECGDIITEHGSDGWRDTFYDVLHEFWQHYETVTGEKVGEQGSVFSCSC